ncbi:rhotekin-like isoform X2 [Amphibalanus amphitrite]|uniref:rhotekin-like isoform X2 n=1 Tax=Amphibalanus amphitrite TaxID=1232801 RepID=UPI001C90D5B4|nr:rhotekin-like isoform X2 [Amphibalanus amphitrite]
MNTCFPSPAAMVGGGSGKERRGERISPPKLDVIQDLDLYYIKQLAHNNKDFDLERKIDVEIKIREGSSRLLAACKHPQQSLEASKTLLTSNERMATYLTELQRRKDVGHTVKWRPHMANLCVSDLRMPLIWKEEDHFRNRGDFRRFAVFCLVRVGTDIFDTTLINPVDRSMTDVCFDDVFVFKKVSPDFTCSVEVYSHVLHEDLSIASTPRKIRQTLHSSISRTVGKRLAASLKDELSEENSGPQFRCIARANLRVQEVDETVRSHDLTLSGDEAKADLPLFGQICCRLAAEPYTRLTDSVAGKVMTKRDGDWSESHGTLRGYQLRLYPSVESREDEDEPIFTAPVDKDTEIVTSPERPLEITVRPDRGDRPELLLRLPTERDADVWLKAMETSVTGSRLWRRAGEQSMTMLTPSARLSSMNTRPRLRSLYEHISLKDDCSSPELPPPPPPRQRAQSTSGIGSFIRWGSLRSRRKLNS